MSEAQEKADSIIQDAQVEVNQINDKATKDAESEKNKILNLLEFSIFIFL